MTPPTTHRQTGPFVPDILLPMQLDLGSRLAQLGPCARLLCAVLEQALTDLRHQTVDGPSTIARDAQAWVLDDDCDGLYSFRHICAVLGFDADAVRASLLRQGFQLETRIRRSARPAGFDPAPTAYRRHERTDRPRRRRGVAA